MHKACFGGDISLVKLLIERGANMYLKTKSGDTTFDIAKQQKREDIATFLRAQVYSWQILTNCCLQHMQKTKTTQPNNNNNTMAPATTATPPAVQPRQAPAPPPSTPTQQTISPQTFITLYEQRTQELLQNASQLKKENQISQATTILEKIISAITNDAPIKVHVYIHIALTLFRFNNH